MSATLSHQHQSPSEYRTTEYHDKEVVRIEETRRRRPTAGLVSNTAPYRRTRVSKRPGRSITSSGDLPSDQKAYQYPSAGAERMLPSASSHVTFMLMSSSKAAKPVIIQTTTTPKTKHQDSYSFFGTSSLPTPPPTPRIERIPTPELSDLEETPFCECCRDTRYVKYCASCRVELYGYA